MINEWKKVVNAITSTGAFTLCLSLCVLLGLSAKRHFHLRWKRFAHTDHESLHHNLTLCPEKVKQDLESLNGFSLSYKIRTGEGS